MPHAIDSLLWAACCIATAMPPESGVLNFVNVTCTPETMEVRVDGEPLSPRGYLHGEFSGGLLFPMSRAIRVEAIAPGCAPLLPVRLTPRIDQSQLVVFYAAKEPCGSGSAKTIKARILPHREPTALRSVTGIYLGSQPLIIVRCGSQNITLAADAPAEIWKGNRASFSVAMPDQTVQIALDEPGHYWLVLCDPIAGLASHVLVPDMKYSIPVFDPKPPAGRE